MHVIGHGRTADGKRVAIAVVSGTAQVTSRAAASVPCRQVCVTKLMLLLSAEGGRNKDMGGLLLENGRDFLWYQAGVDVLFLMQQ